MVSMFAIVFCHIFQYYDMRIAWWLNIGVQLFLCIFGWLYAEKSIDEPVKWFLKNCIKILVPVWTFMIVALPIYMILDGTSSIMAGFTTIVLHSFLKGFAHLWYIPCMLFCYLITPLLQNVWKYISKRRVLLDLLVFLVVFQIIVVLFFSKFSAPWVSCYVIAYFLRKLRVEANNNKVNIIENFIMVAGFVLSTIRLIFEIQGINTMVGSLTLFNCYVNYSKMFLGLTIFLLSYRILSKFNLPRHYSRLLNLSDKYSFEIYIVHQYFILGACSLLKVDISAMKYLILVIAIIVSSLALKIVSEKLKQLLLKRI